MDYEGNQVDGTSESGSSIRSDYAEFPVDNDRQRERSRQTMSSHKDGSNVRDGTALSDIADGKKSNRPYKNSPPFNSNTKSNVTSRGNDASRFYLNTEERMGVNLNDDPSGSRNKYALATFGEPPSPGNLCASNKDMSISMEALQMEDADHLSSSDEEDENVECYI